MQMMLACLGASEPPNERATQRMLMMLMMLAGMRRRHCGSDPADADDACMSRAMGQRASQREGHLRDAHDAHDACVNAPETLRVQMMLACLGPWARGPPNERDT